MKSKQQQHLHEKRNETTTHKPNHVNIRIVLQKRRSRKMDFNLYFVGLLSVSVCVLPFFPFACITQLYAFSIFIECSLRCTFSSVIQCACETFSLEPWGNVKTKCIWTRSHTHFDKLKKKNITHTFHYHYYLHFNLTCIQHSTVSRLAVFFSAVSTHRNGEQTAHRIHYTV